MQHHVVKEWTFCANNILCECEHFACITGHWLNCNLWAISTELLLNISYTSTTSYTQQVQELCIHWTQQGVEYDPLSQDGFPKMSVVMGKKKQWWVMLFLYIYIYI